MFKLIRVLLIGVFSVLLTVSCSSPAAETAPVLPSPTFTNTPPYPTNTPTQPRATATIVVTRYPTEIAYCHDSLGVKLNFFSVSDAQELNEDEIVQKLMEQYLAYYHSPQAPDYCRLDEYYIERVYYDEYYSNLPLEPKGDFMRQVLYSVKPVQLPGFWRVWGGKLDQQNWLHLGANVAIFRSDSGYTMKFAYP